MHHFTLTLLFSRLVDTQPKHHRKKMVGVYVCPPMSAPSRKCAAIIVGIFAPPFTARYLSAFDRGGDENFMIWLTSTITATADQSTTTAGAASAIEGTE